MNPPAAARFAAVTLVACLLVDGCDSPGRRSPRDSDAPAERPVAMRGAATFFDGQIRAEATVSRGRAIPFSEGHDGGGRTPGGGTHNGGGGRRHHREETETSADTSEDTPRTFRGSSMPPVTMRLQLVNTSNAPMSVRIHDVKSDLGNFAVRPERLDLAPGQAGELDPMVSELGVTSDEIPVTLVLVVSGKTESRDLILKNLFAPPAAK